MLQTFHFDGSGTGPKILILGSIHGNEPCGSQAIDTLCESLKAGKYRLSQGEIRCISWANPKACAESLRYIESDLNRAFGIFPQNYEGGIAKEIAKEIAWADFVLDIHSFSSGVDPFVCIDFPNDSQVVEIAQLFPVKYGVIGWPDLFPKTAQLDTIGYAASRGKKGIMIECGQHADVQAQHRALEAIFATLQYFGVLHTCVLPSKNLELIQLQSIFYKVPGGVFARDWKNFDVLARGEILAYDTHNTPISMPHDGYMILPNAHAHDGDEWGYFGTPYHTHYEIH